MSTIQAHEEDTSAMGRVGVWKWTLRFVAENPLGGGFDAYRVSRIAETVQTRDGGTVTYYASGKAFHSVYFEMLGEHGIPGMLMFLSMLTLTYWILWRARVYGSQEGHPWLMSLATRLDVWLFSPLCGRHVHRNCLSTIHLLLHRRRDDRAEVNVGTCATKSSQVESITTDIQWHVPQQQPQPDCRIKPATMSSRPSEIVSLTMLRGIAAWWVVLYHVRDSLVPLAPGHLIQLVLSYGFIAVDLFFVLSGFVIWMSYPTLREPISLGDFFRYLYIRLCRIYPLHAVLLVMYVSVPMAILLFSSAKDLGGRFSIEYFLASLFLIQNWGIFQSLQWNIPAWSISSEFAAYVVSPLIILFATRYSNSALKTMVVIIGLSGCIALLFYSTGTYSLGAQIATLGTPRCILQFAIGVCCAQLYFVYKPMLAHHFAFAVIAMICIGLGISLVGPRNYVIAPLVFALLILGSAKVEHAFPFIFKKKVLWYLGTISYSTYLVHYLIKDVFKFLFVSNDSPTESWVLACYILSCLLLSVLLYHSVEKPARRVFRRALAR